MVDKFRDAKYFLPSDYPTYQVVLKKKGKSFFFPCHEIFLARAPYFRSLFDFVERKSVEEKEKYVPNLEVDNIPAFLAILLSFYGIDAMDNSLDFFLQAYAPALKIRRWKEWKRTLLLSQAMDFLGLDFDKKIVQRLTPPEGEIEDFQRLVSTLPHCGLSREVILQWGERWREIYVVERPTINMSDNNKDSYDRRFRNMIHTGSVVKTLRRHSNGEIYLAGESGFYSVKVKEMLLPKKKVICRDVGSSLSIFNLGESEFRDNSNYCSPFKRKDGNDGNEDTQKIVFFSKKTFAICDKSSWESFWESRGQRKDIKIWKDRRPFANIKPLLGKKSFAASGQTLSVIPSSEQSCVIFYSLRREDEIQSSELTAPSRSGRKSKKVAVAKEEDFPPLPSEGRKITYRSKSHPEISFGWTFGKKSRLNDGKKILVSEGNTPNVVLVLDENSGQILSEIEVEYPILPKGSIIHRDKVYIIQNQNPEAYVSVHYAMSGVKIWELRHSSKEGWCRIFACRDSLFCQSSFLDYKSIESRYGESERDKVFYKPVRYDIFSAETFIYEDSMEFIKIKDIYG